MTPVEAAAQAIKDKLAPFARSSGTWLDARVGWGATCEELAEAALAAVTPLIVQATADAIAAHQAKFVQSVFFAPGGTSYPVRGLSWTDAQSAIALAINRGSRVLEGKES